MLWPLVLVRAERFLKQVRLQPLCYLWIRTCVTLKQFSLFSSSAADLYITACLHKFVQSEEGSHINMHRLYAPSHDRRTIPSDCQRYIALDSNHQLSIQPKKIAACQLLITTTSMAFHIPLDNKFSHILIDEGAQMLETEAIIPLALATPGTCVVLAGDHKQMGPTVWIMKLWINTLFTLILYYYEQRTTG